MLFVQKSRIGRRTFEVREGHLEVGWKVNGEPVQVRFPLADIDPEFDELIVPRPFSLIIPLGLAVLCAVATRALLNQQVFPKQMSIWSGALIPAFLWMGLRWLPPVRLRRFRSRRGEFMFDLVRENSQAKQVDEFLATLSKAISAARR